MTRDGSLSAHFEHTVAVTADGPWILTAREVPVAARQAERERQSASVGVVIETLPQRAVSGAGSTQGRMVTAHIADRMDRNFVRILVGDRVRVELSPATSRAGGSSRSVVG